MRKPKVLPVEKLKAGMVLTQPVISKRGQTIAKKGTVLNRQLISRFSFYKITEVEVENDFTEDSDYNAPLPPAPEPVVEVVAPEPEPEPEPPKPEPPKERTYVEESRTYTLKVQSSPEYQSFQINYTMIITNLQKAFEEIRNGKTDINPDVILYDVSKLFASKTPLQLFTLIHTMRAIDDSVYAHSINVALISRAIGRWLKLSREELDRLTLAGLFHDIGKIEIPEEVLNKQEALTDEEFALIKKHPQDGNRLLKKSGADSDLCFAALQHHERFDGSGYPRQLTGDEIDDFAAIIAIADVYDAMTASRSYREPKCAFEVIRDFEQDGYQKYHPKFIMTFLSHIANLYLNAQVILSDGRSARVIFINRNKLSAPIVELSDGSKEAIDLSHTPELFIKKIL